MTVPGTPLELLSVFPNTPQDAATNWREIEAWQKKRNAWTPIVHQTTDRDADVQAAAFRTIGNMCFGMCSIHLLEAGAAATLIVNNNNSLPPMVDFGIVAIVGTAIRITGGAQQLLAVQCSPSTNSFQFRTTDTGGSSTYATALANGDSLRFSFQYFID